MCFVLESNLKRATGSTVYWRCMNEEHWHFWAPVTLLGVVTQIDTQQNCKCWGWSCPKLLHTQRHCKFWHFLVTSCGLAEHIGVCYVHNEKILQKSLHVRFFRQSGSYKITRRTRKQNGNVNNVLGDIKRSLLNGFTVKQNK